MPGISSERSGPLAAAEIVIEDPRSTTAPPPTTAMDWGPRASWPAPPKTVPTGIGLRPPPPPPKSAAGPQVLASAPTTPTVPTKAPPTARRPHWADEEEDANWMDESPWFPTPVPVPASPTPLPTAPDLTKSLKARLLHRRHIRKLTSVRALPQRGSFNLPLPITHTETQTRTSLRRQWTTAKKSIPLRTMSLSGPASAYQPTRVSFLQNTRSTCFACCV